MLGLNLKLKRDTFKYSRKRKQSTKAIAITTISILCSVILACLVAATLGFDPITIFINIFSKGITDYNNIINGMTIFVLSGFAFSFASKAGIFNIGISGQMVGAGLAIVIISKYLGFLNWPPGLGQIFIMVIAALVGGLIALLIGFLEIRFKVNSVVSAILLNWIIYLIAYFIIATYFPDAATGGQLTGSLEISDSFRLYINSSNEILNGSWLPCVIIIILVAIAILITFKYSVFGHKIKTVGLSFSGSQYAGYNVNSIKLRAFFISGMISGLLAMVVYASISPKFPLSTFSVNVPNEGFTGIAVSLIANNNPIGILFVAAILGIFQNAAPYLEISKFNDIIIGVVMLGSALSVVLYNTKPWYRLLSINKTIFFQSEIDSFFNKKDSLLSKYKSISRVSHNDMKEQLSIAKNDNNSIEIKRIKEQYKKYLKEQSKKYDLEFDFIKTTYKKNKIYYKMVLALKPDHLIDKYINIISNKYDTDLTKYVSKQKDKISKLELKKKQLKDQNKIENIDKKIIKIEQGIRESIEASNKWKNNKISKIDKKYHRKNLTEEKIQSITSKFTKTINKIDNKDIKEDLLKVLNEINVQLSLNKGGL